MEDRARMSAIDDGGGLFYEPVGNLDGEYFLGVGWRGCGIDWDDYSAPEYGAHGAGDRLRGFAEAGFGP